MESLGTHFDRESIGVSPRQGTVPADDSAGNRPEDRIVVGLDGSFGSALALRWAAREAAELGVTLDVVAVWTEADPERPTLDRRPDAPLSVARERLEHALASLVRAPIPPERIVATPLHGTAGEVLVARARNARLLVLGTSGIECPTIPGSTGVYCLRHSTAPVVFVPAPDA
ncbi:universal stress protein [Embleya scabrispora]|uniref:universal stress protein n=1 Tax=Embleya scabrispora TaxID=159449 RepID=UPI000373C9DC|nr:universal stress protein [Embleya scabrispora]MYS80680.1 universal stress protein [Streptomyces sp. SID5474]